MNFESLNHFAKFGLKPSFEIDPEQLEDKYIKLQQQFHPDVLVNKDIKEQNKAIAASIAANQAYEILKNPLKRAIYLLKLQNIDINDDHCQIKPDPQTLMLVMQIQEQIAAGHDKQQIRNSVKSKIAGLMQKSEKLFNSKQYNEAAEKLIEVKYLDKILKDTK